MTPSEADEQKVLVRYLAVRNIPHFRVPNETYTKSWKQKANNKALGVSSGVPDLFVVVPKRHKAFFSLIGIEMKRAKKSLSHTSDTQEKWITLLNGAGVPTRVCYGAAEAIAFVEEIEKSN